jgi:D-alanyl-D-alanine carboxypeptidase/D-alanyl-D-alanine-endopeptidase (penicillin-binding protein 4)
MSPTAARMPILRALAAGLLWLAVAPLRAAPDPLPAAFADALARAGLAPDAVVAIVQQVGPADRDLRPRLIWQPDRPMNPASLMKLLTTYASLELLGPAWTWRTPVWLHGTVRDGVLDGNLVIKGSGDPKLVVERLWLMLRRVQQLGVREIRGDIVLDRSAFSVPPRSAGDFDGEALRPYNVLADALMLNFKSTVFTVTPEPERGVARLATDLPLAGVRVDGSVPLVGGVCADWRTALRADFNDPGWVRFGGNYAASCGERTWAVAYGEPNRYNELALAGLWRDIGGRLTGQVRDGIAPATPPSFESTSPPLAELVRDINKFSNNVMAQQLFLTLGLTQRDDGSPEAAREVLRQWTTDRLGARAVAGLVIDNGSGLSRDARLSARLLAQLLATAWASPVMPELMSSLPVSGVDGTLQRPRATLVHAHLKTGSLRDVAGVAGYVLANSGQRYVVVTIVNDPNAQFARPAFDALLQWTAADAPAPDASAAAPPN